MTIEEESMIETMEYSVPGFAEFMAEVYSEIAKQLPICENIYFLDNAFDDLNEQIWIDFSHITPEGNKIVSKTISDTISQKIIKQN